MIDLTKIQATFPHAYIALSEHIKKSDYKYKRSHSEPKIGEYRGLEYSLPKLSRHLHSLITGTVIDPASGSHQALALAWHSLNCAEEFYSLMHGSSTSSPESVQHAIYGEIV